MSKPRETYPIVENLPAVISQTQLHYDNWFHIVCGDSERVLKKAPDNSVDSIVCDPPYGIHHGNKAWDMHLPNVGLFRELRRVLKPGGHLIAFSATRTYQGLASTVEQAGFEIRDMITWNYSQGMPKGRNGEWGSSALKPSFEPAVLARKPLEGTLAKNVKKWGTGGLDIEGCRQSGGWPANTLTDETNDMFPPNVRASFYCPKPTKKEKNAGLEKLPVKRAISRKSKPGTMNEAFAGALQRNPHPTVKPVDLMRWLCRLVTPPGGLVLDPFVGSGSTGVSALREGYDFLGIDLSEEYCRTARLRCEHTLKSIDPVPIRSRQRPKTGISVKQKAA